MSGVPWTLTLSLLCRGKYVYRRYVWADLVHAAVLCHVF